MSHTLKKLKAISLNLWNYFKHEGQFNFTFIFLRSVLGAIKRRLKKKYFALLNLKNRTMHIDDLRIQKLQRQAKGLHQLLSQKTLLTYSILLPVNNPNDRFFNICLESLLIQCLPSCEILIGFSNPPSPEIRAFIISKKKDFKIKEFYYLNQDEYKIINSLAQEATGNYLFILDQEDWVRPDLLLRLEQTLCLIPYPEKTVLFCNENRITHKNIFIPGSELHKPKQFHFPYFFEPFSEKGMLFPKKLWDKVGGLRSNYLGAEYEDLLLRLDLQSALFQHIPLALYSVRLNAKKSKKSLHALLYALEDYSQVKKLNWEWKIEEYCSSIKASPQINQEHSVQVIIPFKDQKDIILKCVQQVLKQKEVKFKITAIDNRSQDPSIAREIERLGGEVFFIDEPFNYSRLNNFAVKNTQLAKDCDLILFLNNDVELEPNALLEMVRWIDQPYIGLVGCRLHYPNGLLQHGGVKISSFPSQAVQWEHEEIFYRAEQIQLANKIRITDGLTAACVLIKKQEFIRIGGFDEIWFPIAYSDTDLVMKLKNKGLLCLYTPYAKGVHYESLSRGQTIEDYESLWWLHQLVNKKHNHQDEIKFRI